MSMDAMDHAKVTEQLRLESLTECEACGDTFTDRLISTRRARGMNVCIQCARDNDQPLDAEDLNDLAEEYWTGREQAAGDGGYYSSERMDAARRIGH